MLELGALDLDLSSFVLFGEYGMPKPIYSNEVNSLYDSIQFYQDIQRTE
jgi:hypothetical protein